MSYLYAAGRYANLLERAASITLTPTVDSLYPAANLYDPRPSRIGRHGSNAANPEVRWDLNGLAGGSPYTMTVRAGERRHVKSTSGSVTIQNLATLKYLTSGAAWQTGSTTCLSGTGDLDYTVESMTLCGNNPTVSLKVTYTTATDWPRWNAVVVFGHNLDPGLTCEMRSSTDNFSASNVLEQTGTILQPSFYVYDGTTGIANRYGRLLLTGTNSAIPWYGIIMPCWLEVSAGGIKSGGVEIGYREPQIRNTGPMGSVGVYPLSPWPQRVAKLSFALGSTAETELRNEIVLRCRGGAYGAALAPLSTESAVVYGRLTSEWSERRVFNTVYESDFVIAEEPIAVPL
jgi:hypothetical protein